MDHGGAGAKSVPLGRETLQQSYLIASTHLPSGQSDCPQMGSEADENSYVPLGENNAETGKIRQWPFLTLWPRNPPCRRDEEATSVLVDLSQLHIAWSDEKHLV